MKKICSFLLIATLLCLCGCSGGASQYIKTAPDEIKLQLNSYQARVEQGDGSFPIINMGERLYENVYSFQIDGLFVLCVYQDHQMQVTTVVDCMELFPESKDALNFLKFDFSSSASDNGRYILLRGPECWYIFDVAAEKLQKVNVQSDAMTVDDDGKLIAYKPPEETLIDMQALEQYAWEKATIKGEGLQNTLESDTEEFEHQLLKERAVTCFMPCNDGEREILYSYVFACAVDEEFSGKIIELKY